MSDYDQQQGAIADRLSNPEVSPEESLHPGFWGGLSVGTPVQGAASGALEAGSVLTNGISAFLRRLPAKGTINPLGVGLSEEAQRPWEESIEDARHRIADSAREGAKAVMPDPRLTGTAANVVLGSSKMLTEAGLTAAATGGNPFAVAGGLGAIQATARYQDYRDQGVDDATAQRLALVEGGGAALGALAPVGLPVSWLANLTPARQLLTDLATGAASNVGMGGASRYATHKILEDAGYHDLAEQSKVFDGESILTDMLTGGGFGGLHWLGSRQDLAQQARDLGESQSVVADNARAAQDAQQVVERAPGVPVDAPSQAAHRAALEKATADLLADKPVDVADEAKGTFARPAENTRPMREVLHDEFKKAGVMDEWSKLEDLNDLLEAKYEPPSVKPIEREETELPISETEAVPPEEGGYSVEEEALTDEQRAAFEGLRSQLPGDEDLSADLGRAGETGQRPESNGGTREGAPLRVFRGSDRELLPEHFDEGALGKASGHPSSGLGVFFTNDKDDASKYGPIVTSHHLDIRNPKVIPVEDVPSLDSREEYTAYRDQLRAQGHDGLVIDASHVGGANNYVAFGPEQVRRANEPSDLALANAKTVSDKVADDAPKLFSAAADCASRTR